MVLIATEFKTYHIVESNTQSIDAIVVKISVFDQSYK